MDNIAEIDGRTMRCSHCAELVRPEAVLCMYCNNKLNKGSSKYPLVFLTFFVIVIFTVSIGSLLPSSDRSTHEFRGIVKANLKDSESALFSDDRIVESKDRKGIYYLCGLVNAKNSYGAYTGFKRFFAGHPNAVMIDDGTTMFDDVWQDMCAD